jgi:hypothetical protein
VINHYYRTSLLYACTSLLLTCLNSFLATRGSYFTQHNLEEGYNILYLRDFAQPQKLVPLTGIVAVSLNRYFEEANTILNARIFLQRLLV